MLEEYITYIGSEVGNIGFFNTKAKLCMDVVISYLVLLPVLSAVSIYFAIINYLKLHQLTQFLLFFLTLSALVAFGYIVHFMEGFDVLVSKSTMDASNILLILCLHVIMAITTLSLWLFTLLYALSDKKRRALPGFYSQSHRNSGKQVFKAIFLLALTSSSVYWMLFIV